MLQRKTNYSALLKEIAVIAIPVALQNLLSTTGSMVDTMMLATLGETTVSAVGMCSQFSGLFLFCYWGFVAGGTMFVTQYWGAKDADGIRRAYGISLCMIFAIGMVFAILALCFPQLVMGIYTDKPEIQRIGIGYLRVVGYMFPLQSFTIAMSMLLRSTEHVRCPLVGGIVSVVSNCVCNYILIFGKFGAPALGVTGAAIGTLAASVLNLLVLLVFVLACRIPYALELHRCFRWDRAFVAEYFKRSSPILVNECGMGFGNTLISAVLGRQSAAAIAAVAIFKTVENMVWAFFTGFSSAGSIISGKEVGAGNHEAAQEKTRFIVYLTSGVVFFLCLVMLAIHTPLFTMLGLSGDSFAICTAMWIAYCFIAPIRMGNWQHNDCFRSGGDSLYGTVLEICCIYLLLIPGVYIAHFAFHAPFMVIFVMSYWDEPLRYFLMQRHLYSRRWIQPVSDKGLETIAAFREKYQVNMESTLPDRIRNLLHK